MTVRLLGGFVVQVNERVIGVEGFPRRDAAHLVQLLALAPNRRLHREQVMDALWPEAGLDVATNRLHKAAHYARSATRVADAVTLRNDVVSLFPAHEVNVDATDFEAAARAALADNDSVAAESALGMWGG
ncbi:MAG TPA: hypothetical protein VFE86_03205, partial [Ilumatobacteraceae bacterium]|nr:hypothetical protein [Ilumatobacteraceae bacterium]